MKVAIASRIAVNVLSLLALAALAGGAEAQGKPERGPETVAPNLKRRPAPLPPPRSKVKRPRGGWSSANEDAPTAPGRGCPDQGRKLELIV